MVFEKTFKNFYGNNRTRYDLKKIIDENLNITKDSIKAFLLADTKVSRYKKEY